MKILCIFLTFVFTVSCGPSVSQKKTKEDGEKKRECYLVRGACKTSCNTWEYIYNYCSTEPCCVIREYQKPVPKPLNSTRHIL
ncbi:beta-defensin 113 [Ursus americanus]|uniref:Beta-defensin n=2 Tax=Ursus TaxID=9639 RepID=A0A452TCZ0_URSMA|nr:beta-defensin 113 [Ursus arctos]XP_040499357.1 beta-defensin 113 [Ursus maritimus]XP_045660680.1 beta-defensin 113 [Ursus americanus]